MTNSVKEANCAELVYGIFGAHLTSYIKVKCHRIYIKYMNVYDIYMWNNCIISYFKLTSLYSAINDYV